MFSQNRFQFYLDELFMGITILSCLVYGMIYLFEPHLIQDGHYIISVDYSRTLKDMIIAGKYQDFNLEFNFAIFSINQTRSGIENLDAIVVHLDKEVKETDDVLKLMDKKGLRPATLPELLALGERYPRLQENYDIVALASRWPNGGEWSAPFLGYWCGARRLCLDWCAHRWGGHCRFLAFRK